MIGLNWYILIAFVNNTPNLTFKYFLEKALYLFLYSFDCLVGIGCFATVSLRICTEFGGGKPFTSPVKIIWESYGSRDAFKFRFGSGVCGTML